jgi:hypothetical protein
MKCCKSYQTAEKGIIQVGYEPEDTEYLVSCGNAMFSYDSKETRGGLLLMMPLVMSRPYFRLSVERRKRTWTFRQRGKSTLEW